MSCDLCGYNGILYPALVENSLMSVCKKCLSFGKQIERNKDFNVNQIIKKQKEENLVLLKENYNLLLKEAREKSNLTQEDLAKKINEKVSLVQKTENKEITPNENLIKKFESFFNISLFENFRDDKDLKLNMKNNTLTIGDLIKLKKRK